MTTSRCRCIVTSQLRRGYQKRSKSTMTAAIPSEYPLPETKSFDDIPGPMSVPVLGGLLNHLPYGEFYKKKPVEIYEICRNTYGNIYKEKLFNFTFVHLFDPSDFETVLRNDGRNPIREAFLTLSHYNKKHNGGVQGILTSQQESWHDLRSKFQQKMLRPKAVAAYFNDHSIAADDLVKKIERSQQGGVVYDIRNDLDKFATECVGLVCFNKRFELLVDDIENKESQQFFDAVNVVMETSHQEFKRLPLYLLFDTKSFKKFARAQDLIKRRAVTYSKLSLDKMEKEASPSSSTVDGEHGDLVPYLMTKTSLTDDQVFCVISELIFAGIDTTSHHLSFMLYLLGTHPQVQEKLYHEITRCAPMVDIMKSEDVQKMSYLKAVDKEVHRLLPVASGTIRTLSKDIELQGYQVPAGATVVLHFGMSSSDPAYFSFAKSFRPERWLRDSAERKFIHPFASTPFGFGKRACIGRRFAEQESYLATIKILQKYQIEYVGEELALDYGVTTAPGNKMAFRFTPRNS